MPAFTLNVLESSLGLTLNSHLITTDQINTPNYTHHDILYLSPHPQRHSSEAQRFITTLDSHKKLKF